MKRLAALILIAMLLLTACAAEEETVEQLADHEVHSIIQTPVEGFEVLMGFYSQSRKIDGSET